jgi:hypothetical protein
MSRKTLAPALVVALATAGTGMMANATSVIGATEPTQIMNNVELVAQYEKQVQMVLNQVKQYQATLQQLQQLNPDALKTMLKGVVGEDVGEYVLNTSQAAMELEEELSTIQEAMHTIYQEGRIASDVMRHLQGRGRSISGGDYVALMKALAEENQATYGKRVKQFTRSLEESRSAMRRVEAIAATAPQITGDVQGLQALIQSQAVVSGQLAGIHKAVIETGMMNADAARTLASEMNDRRVQELQQRQATEYLLYGRKPGEGGGR